MIEIDGSYGEGGGQLIRTSCTFAALYGVPVRVFNIRAKREKPGLARQHLMAVKACAELSSAHLTGADLGSQEVILKPTTQPREGKYRWEIGSAGSTALVFQTVFPVLAFVGGTSRLTLTGGTHNTMAPSADYLEHVYAPRSEGLGWNLDVDCPRTGFYPRGMGVLAAHTEHSRPMSFDLTENITSARLEGAFIRYESDREGRAKQYGEQLKAHLAKVGKTVPIHMLPAGQRGGGIAVTLVVTGQLADGSFVRAGFIEHEAASLTSEEKLTQKVLAFVKDKLRLMSIWATC